MRLPLLVAACALLVACETPSPALAPLDVAPVPIDADAASADAASADATDAATTEVGVDAPAPTQPRTCSTCLYDSECGGGGRCVLFDPMVLPGVRTCLTRCETRGAACDAPVAAVCREDDASGDLLCTPTSSCVPMDSRRAVACPASGCVGRYGVCADLTRTEGVLGRAGTVCLPACARDADCEDGLRRCRPAQTARGLVNVCVPDDRFGPDACGLRASNTRGVGAPCGAETACSTGLECLSDADPALRPFCSARCERDADCGGGAARCLALGARGNFCVPDDCACAAGARDELLDRALAQGDSRWSRCNLYFSNATLDAFGPNVTRDRFRLPVFDRVHRDWLFGARWAREMGPGLDRSTSLSATLASAAALRLDGGLTWPLAASPVAGSAAGLLGALESVYAYGAKPFDRAATEAAIASLPDALRSALTRILVASVSAARARDLGLPFATDPAQREHLWAFGPHTFLPTNRAGDRPDFSSAIDLGSLQGDVRLPTQEALTLAATIEAIDWTPLRGMMSPALNLETPLGRVVVRDGAAHRYEADAYERTLLIIDLGGDDTYLAPVASNVDVETPVSVLIDLGGADTYTYPEVASALDRPDTLPSDRDGRSRAGATATPSVSRAGRQGSARLGVALLYDLGGSNDRYRSLRMSQGFAAFGVGGLYDDGGDDQYELEAGGQGAAIGGVAALVDAGGADRYSAWAFAEGFAYVQGVGVLYDRDGNDIYDSKVTPVLYGSPQDGTVNSSFTQGAGFGRRGDASADRTNMSGGIGVLRDRAGDDRYTTAIFGQATGYWGGMGLLLDGAGDDAYDGRWYVQGGAAHFAYAALVDGAGRDTHNAVATRQNMTAGAGHDFSLGILLALGREADTYRVPNLALGAGNANGAGIFADQGGDDVYEAPSPLSLGNAALETLTDPGRLMRPTVGVFLDGDGSDTYRRATMPPGPEGNGRLWSQRIHPEAPSERGFAGDATGGRTGVTE